MPCYRNFFSVWLSTLVIQPQGVAALKRWGHYDEVAATGCPPIDQYRFDFGPLVISGRPRPIDGNATAIAIAPRRTVLDKVLVDAAARAGAEVRQGFTVDEVLFEDGAVVGIRGHADRASEVVERRPGRDRRRRPQLPCRASRGRMALPRETRAQPPQAEMQ